MRALLSQPSPSHRASSAHPAEELAPGQVQVWVARTGEGLATLAGAEELLSAGELAEGERFKFPAHRDRHLASHAFRRRVLGAHLDAPAAHLLFSRGPRGKPELAGRWADQLNFSQTDSEGLALLAVAHRRVGVDVERERHVNDAAAIVERFASMPERAAFAELRAADRQRRFLGWWTAKEAYVKALGEGLFRPLDSFTVEVGPGPQLRLLETGEPEPAGDWWLECFRPAPGFLGTVAVEGSRGRLTLRSA